MGDLTCPQAIDHSLPDAQFFLLAYCTVPQQPARRRLGAFAIDEGHLTVDNDVVVAGRLLAQTAGRLTYKALQE